VAWGLGTEAPTPAEAQQNMQQNMQRLQKDLLRKPGTKAPATAGTQTPAARHLSRRAPLYGLAATVVGMVLGVRWACATRGG
jgi:ferric-dicitrate binding protein FerR (iron transport regulator)